MSPLIVKPSRYKAREIIREGLELSTSQQRIMSDCLSKSLDVWIGIADGQVCCVWGVIPPTILSNRAYLWLHADEKRVAERQFTFIRHSQIEVKVLLERFDVLFGVTEAKNQKAVRWLTWLGAEFERGVGGMLEFKIGRK